MDYEFTLDEYSQPVAKFSMGHEAIGRWLTEELGESEQKIDQLISIIEQVGSQEIKRREIKGTDFELRIERDEVEVVGHHVDDDSEEPPEDTSFYQAESVAGCGLKDFKQAVLAWRIYVGG